MSTLSIALPRMKKIPRPPKALIWKAAQCLCWGIWTVFCVMGTLVLHRWWDAIFAAIYAKWMIRDYRDLIKMVEAWLDERPVKMPEGSRFSRYAIIVWTVVGAPIALLPYLH